uniref:Uncharacterized protein n=1 Tax=Acetobacter pasteurianus TaxID=438 RepID=A0A0S3JPS1_ACEPA|nr:hypothetical protein DB34_14700 [Acetobacter pasteurianus]
MIHFFKRFLTSKYDVQYNPHYLFHDTGRKFFQSLSVFQRMSEQRENEAQILTFGRGYPMNCIELLIYMITLLSISGFVKAFYSSIFYFPRRMNCICNKHATERGFPA